MREPEPTIREYILSSYFLASSSAERLVEMMVARQRFCNGGTSGADMSIYDPNSGLSMASSTYQNGHVVSLIYPIKKGKTINYFYANFSNPYLRFIYAQGEV